MLKKVLNKWFIRGVESGRKYACKWLDDNSSYTIYGGDEQTKKLKKKGFIVVKMLLTDDKLLKEMEEDCRFLNSKNDVFANNLEKTKNEFKKGFIEGWDAFLGIDVNMIKLLEMEKKKI